MRGVLAVADAVTLACAVLPPETASAARARALVRSALTQDEGGLADLVPDAELVMGELAANAVIHGLPEPFVVMVAVPAAGQVLVVVEDGSPSPPVIRERPDEHGHGLRLVDAVCRRWGWAPLSGRTGKQVFGLLGEGA
jgi:anti-sigma regulatory factor (Ser/Thr protein kinase)